MSIQLDEIYRQVQILPLNERLELLGRVLMDLKADLELREELADWERLGNEALDLFEQSL
jgi:hypothetical protein